jgi:diadenosine tetraphosphate (Ap4A) HIT family hydrolase
MPDERRTAFDLESYVERVRSGPCFVCGIARGDEGFRAHVVFRDERHIAFLPNFHVLLGYVLVAPIEHREAVAGAFAADEYLSLQRVVHRVARALEATVPTERIYILSLGSQQGNAHVHWHVAALPPGVPYDEQQFRALMAESKGVLVLTDHEKRELAGRLRTAIADVQARDGTGCWEVE